MGQLEIIDSDISRLEKVVCQILDLIEHPELKDDVVEVTGVDSKRFEVSRIEALRRQFAEDRW